MADSEAVFDQVTRARYILSTLEQDSPECREALTPLRKALKELHYLTLPWAT